MSTERVTVFLPDDVRRPGQRIVDELGLSFSAVVTQALTWWLRAHLVDAWLAWHQAEQGAFDEDELRALAAQAGVPYLAPGDPADLHALVAHRDVPVTVVHV